VYHNIALERTSQQLFFFPSSAAWRVGSTGIDFPNGVHEQRRISCGCIVYLVNPPPLATLKKSDIAQRINSGILNLCLIFPFLILIIGQLEFGWMGDDDSSRVLSSHWVSY
jgi:hypothetical protein